ncbi:MAG: trigger factor [Endomicrobium sp.]|jgi:trigger factor|nr:trigger factor [Endomicrobium sp.]
MNKIDFKYSFIDKKMCFINIFVEVPSNIIENEINFIFVKMQQQVKINGFRQGKIPDNIAKEKFINESKNEAIKKIIRKTIFDIVKNEKFDIVCEPKIDKFNYDFKKKLEYTVTFECHPKINLINYKNIQIKNKSFEITDKNLNERINFLRKKNAILIPSKSIKINENSLVFVDCVAYNSDGEIVKEATVKNYMIDLKSGQTRNEFKIALKGLEIGDEKKIKIEYKVDCKNKVLSDKTITFNIKVIEIKEVELPELNDDFAKDLGVKNLEDLMENVRKSIESENEINKNNDIENQIIEYLLENNEFDVPESLVNNQEKCLIEKNKKRFENNIEFEKEKIRNKAKRDVKLFYILDTICKNENIIVTDYDFEMEKNRIKKLNPNKKNIVDKYFFNKKDEIFSLLKNRKIFDFLINNSIVNITKK